MKEKFSRIRLDLNEIEIQDMSQIEGLDKLAKIDALELTAYSSIIHFHRQRSGT